MKHLMTLLALVVAVTAGAQTEWPWNPDSDSDNIIGTVDLLSLLSVFGAEFYIEYPASSENETTVALVKKEGNTDAFGCMSYCSSIDVEDPRGGVRHSRPGYGYYLINEIT